MIAIVDDLWDIYRCRWPQIYIGGWPGRCNQREASQDGKSRPGIQPGSGSVLHNTWSMIIIPDHHISSLPLLTFWPLMLSFLPPQLYEPRWQIEEAWDSTVSATPPFPVGSPAWERCRATDRQGRQCRREPRHCLSTNWKDYNPSLPDSSLANQSFKMSNILHWGNTEISFYPMKSA